MKWVTREHAKVDRIACPWLIRRFIDPHAEFLFVPRDRVMEVAAKEGATPFDVPDVELSHEGPERVSFDAFVKKYRLTDPALLDMAEIVRGADTKVSQPRPESAGLEAIAAGFRLVAKDDFENMAMQFPAYDALYRYCQWRAEDGRLDFAAPR